jgi:signal transduction histidine kinase
VKELLSSLSATLFYTGAVNLPRSTATPRTPGAGLLAPLNPPAYCAWSALVLGPLLAPEHGSTLSMGALVGLAAQLAFAGLFLARASLEKLAPTSKWLGMSIAAQAAAAILAAWMLHDKMQGVLLVLVAAQLPAAGPARWKSAVMVSANVLLLAILMDLFTFPKAIELEIAYVAFQLFASIVAAYAYRAHEAREVAVRANAELLATRRLLEEGTRMEERLRLSRDLHDVIGHKLTALKLQLALKTRGTSPDVDPQIHQCARNTEELLADVRGVVSSLRESDGIDLHQALRALDPKLPWPQITFELDPSVRVPDMRQAEAMLRCAQEGLTNALRHASASEVRIVLKSSTDGLTLLVEDDGANLVQQIERGNGLRGLEERLEQLGGRLRAEPRMPRGFALRAILPEATVGG